MNPTTTPALAERMVETTADLAGCTPQEVALSALPYDVGSPATGGVWRAEAAGRRYFVKVLQHPTVWPGLAMVPEPMRAEFVTMLPWRNELDMHRAGLADLMPDGMRTARLEHVDEPDDVHVVLWSEWLDLDENVWEDSTFERAAHLLGRLAARRRRGEPINAALPAECLAEPGSALRYFTGGRVLMGVGAELADDELWACAAMSDATERAEVDDLRARMQALARRLPSLLDLLDTLPQAHPHGDASPQNLLRPTAEPDMFVITDWGFGTLHAIGMDLSQLVVGLAHAGLLDPERLPALLEIVVDAYGAGLAAEHWPQAHHAVRAGALVTRRWRAVNPPSTAAARTSMTLPVATVIRV